MPPGYHSKQKAGRRPRTKCAGPPEAHSSLVLAARAERERENARGTVRHKGWTARPRGGMPEPAVCPVNNGCALYLDRALCGRCELFSLSASSLRKPGATDDAAETLKKHRAHRGGQRTCQGPGAVLGWMRRTPLQRAHSTSTAELWRRQATKRCCMQPSQRAIT